MATFLTTPFEILSRIFQACSSFQDVISLASTCKSLNHVWQSEASASAIIWEVGKESIIAFDVALLVVRATEIVRQALENKSLPPHISINMLSGSVRRPSTDEYKKVLDLQHLVRCLELRYTFGLRSLRTMELSDDDYPHLMAQFPNWRENFYRSIYRTFLAGAVCFQAYQEPLSVEKDIFGYFLEILHAFIDEAVDLPDIGHHNPFTEDIDKLVQFPVLQFEGFDAMRPHFHDFTEWFLQDCRAMERISTVEICSGTQNAHDVVLLEIARFLFVNSVASKTSYVHASEGTDNTDPSETSHRRMVDVIFFGKFQLERIMIIGNINTVFAPPSFKLVRMSTYKSIAHNSSDISALLAYLHICSRQPNHRDGFPGVLPPLQLPEYILRIGCNLRFANEAFLEDSGSKSYHNLVYNYELLGDGGDVVLDFAQDAQDVPILTYEYID